MKLTKPEIEIDDDHFRLDGELVDLVAFNHWRQGVEYDGRQDHSPDRMYQDLRSWLSDAQEKEEGIVEDERLVLRLHSILSGLRFSYPERFCVSAFACQKLFAWWRYLKWDDAHWPPQNRFQLDRLKRLK